MEIPTPHTEIQLRLGLPPREDRRFIHPAPSGAATITSLQTHKKTNGVSRLAVGHSR